MAGGPSRAALAVAFLLMVAACEAGSDLGTDDGEPPAAPPTAIEAHSAGATAALLGDPATAEAGVWSVLANLNIGVYTGDAAQILAGAERTDDDSYLYDFEIPILVAMATAEPEPLDELAFLIGATLDFEITVEELEDLFADIFEEVPEHFVAALFGANPPAPDWAVTPFERWVLLLSLLPADREHGPQAMALAAGIGPLADSHCSVAGSGDPGGDIAGAYLDKAVDAFQSGTIESLTDAPGSIGRLAKFREAVGRAASRIAKGFDLARVTIILANVDLSVHTDRDTTHRYHDRRGETAEVSRVPVTATAHWLGYGPPDGTQCGRLARLVFPPPGPIESAGVRFHLDAVLDSHGHIRYPSTQVQARLITDAAGRTGVEYETTPLRPEEAQFLSDDHLRRESGMVLATFDVLGAMGEWFNVFASIEILAQAVDELTRRTSISVEWLEAGGTTAEGHIVTAMDEAGNLFGMEVVLYACDGPTGTWQGEVIVFFPEEGTLGHTEVTFAFPEDTSQVTVAWTIAGQGITVDASFLVEIVGHGDQAVMVLISSGQLVPPEPLSTWQVEGTIQAPIMAGDDPRCPPG